MDPILPTTVVPPTGAPQPQLQPPTQPPPSATSAKIVYGLYLAALFTGGITWLIGLIMAYVNVGDAPEPLRGHYRFQIRTFWIGLLYCLVGGVLAAAFVGFALLALVPVWLIIRCVKGLKALDRGAAYPGVETWLW